MTKKDATDCEIIDIIRGWLSGSEDRKGGRSNRRKRQNLNESATTSSSNCDSQADLFTSQSSHSSSQSSQPCKDKAKE